MGDGEDESGPGLRDGRGRPGVLGQTPPRRPVPRHLGLLGVADEQDAALEVDEDDVGLEVDAETEG